MNNLLELRDFCVSHGPVEAVHGVSLTVGVREIVAVLGPNGAGKTTLLSAIVGLLPSRGQIAWRGASIERPRTEELIAHGIALVPEKRELFGGLSVEDNLTLGGFHHWMAGRGISSERLDWVYQVFPRLKDRRQQLACTLSGGERQMLALGRALMGDPQLLLLDEPSLGLAPLIVKEVFEVIAAMRDSGVAILLVEQNAQAALQIANRGYVLELGELVAQGSSAELKTDARIVAAYLGTHSKPLGREAREAG